MYQETSYYILTGLLGFVGGVALIFFIAKNKVLKIKKIDKTTFLLSIPIIGNIEFEEDKTYRGIFMQDIIHALDRIKFLQGMLDFYTLTGYVKDYNVNYIGIEGDMENGMWSKGRLAYSTLSKGRNGGYNIFLNPDLNRESVCKRLNEQLSLKIKPHELYTFLFFHEIGHTKKAGNKCYLTALINHSLAGGRRSVRRRKLLKSLHHEVEKYADDFAINEILNLRQKGMIENAQYEGCRTG